mgnify:CR=1 FL=1
MNGLEDDEQVVTGNYRAISRDLEDNAVVGEFSLLGADNVGPAVGKDLQQKARLAIIPHAAEVAEYEARLEFELDLAPQIVSVVPQPILRQADGSLVQERDKIVVYFNDDGFYG